jgi:hypothetical protein
MEGKGSFKLQGTPRVPCNDKQKRGGGNIKWNRTRNWALCDVNRLVRTVIIVLKVIRTRTANTLLTHSLPKTMDLSI